MENEIVKIKTSKHSPPMVLHEITVKKLNPLPTKPEDLMNTK